MKSIFQYEPSEILNEVVLGKIMPPFMYRSSIRNEYEYISKFMNSIIDIVNFLESSVNTIDISIIKSRFQSVIYQGIKQEWFSEDRLEINAEHYKSFDMALKYMIINGHTTNNEVSHICSAMSFFVLWCNNHEKSIQFTNFLIKSVIPSIEYDFKQDDHKDERKKEPEYFLNDKNDFLRLFTDIRNHAQSVVDELKNISVFVGQDSLKQSQRELDLKNLNEILYKSGVKPWHK